MPDQEDARKITEAKDGAILHFGTPSTVFKSIPIVWVEDDAALTKLFPPGGFKNTPLPSLPSPCIEQPDEPTIVE